MSTMETNALRVTLRSFAGAVAVVLALAACGDDAAQPVAPSADARQARAKAPVDETKGMVAGVTDEKKKGAPVDLKFEIRSRPSLNESLPIEVVFVPREASELLRATFLATDGVSVSQSPEPAEYKDVQAGGVYRHLLTIVPKQDGVFYITAIVVMNTSGGAAETRTFQIPVLVGAPEDATEATKAPTAETGAAAAAAPTPSVTTDSN